MLTGTIQNVEPPDSSDNYGNQYQFITITDANQQPNRGRIGAKIPYTSQDIGKQISVNVEQKQSQKGPYLYFKKPQDNQYQGQQGPQQARRATNGEDMIKKVRSMALAYAKDLVVAEKLIYSNLEATAIEFTSFIMSGQSFKQPVNQPQETRNNPEWVGDDPPPPTDDGIPY